MRSLKNVIFFLFYVSSSACALSIESEKHVQQWQQSLNDPKVSDANKVYITDSLLLFYVKSNTDSALYFSRLLLQYAVVAHDSESIDYATVFIGSLHRKKGNYDSSIYYYERALKSYKERYFEEGIASIYNNIATVYMEQNRYDLAIKNFNEAFIVFKDSKNFNARANIYSNFADLYLILENYDKAFEYYTIAKETYVKDTVVYDVTNSFRGLAKIYLKRGEFELAKNELNAALEIDHKNGISISEVEDLLLLMQLYLLTDDKRNFEICFNAVKPLKTKSAMLLNEVSYYELYGDYLVSLKQFSRSISVYDSSLFLLREENIPEIRLRVLKKKFKAKLLNRSFDNALSELEEIEKLELQVAELRRDRITQEIDAGYNLKEKEELIDILNEKNKTTEELVETERELSRQKQQQNIFLWIGISAICVFVIYGIFTYRKLKSTKKDLEISVTQKDLLFKELNHRVKNNLAIVNSFLGIEMHGKTNEVQEILKICEGRIHTLGLMHEMLYQSEMIEQVELKLYFEKLVEFISKTIVKDKTSIHLSIKEPVWVSSNKVVLVGLIVNELLTNAMKYAKDPMRELVVSIAVFENEKKVTIQISDNGIGLKKDFDPKKSNSLGMKLAYGLTKQLHGNFSFKNLEQGSLFEIIFEN